MAPQILVLGAPRTGTQSIASALDFLGYGPVYHMSQVWKNNHHDRWTRLIEQKHGASSWAPEDCYDELRDMLESYNALADFPAAIFAEELTKIYPDAKIILSTRPEDAWFVSVDRTIWHAWSTASPSERKKLGTAYQTLLWGGDFPTQGRQWYREHEALVKKLGEKKGKDDFLVYQVSEGWEPLCRLLGKEVPDVEFSNEDAWRRYKE